MKKIAYATIAASTLLLTACGSSDETSPPTKTVTVEAAPTTTETAAQTGRQPGNAAQVGIYVRAVNDMYASNGQPSIDKAEALELADSMCNFLDTGSSPYDAAQVLEEEGFPREYTSELVAKGIAAACTEHLPN
ncbi:DUF732 domain-containing protein [Rhodococcus phenolicus]|uniref:DUF732 domain-containing protein n=1 Tax=Rhodococcus phenolicus TaxID=263849 RepID=UPI00082B28BC|nr:DUF732 domain-containing protein [Rhodococcus phenolicus]